MGDDRRGTPSPLTYYLNATATAHLQAAAQSLGPIRPDLWTTGFYHQAAEHLVETNFFDIIEAAILREKEMLRGIETWQNSHYKRPQMGAPVIWNTSGACLLDHGGDGIPTLVIPSLINRPYILDLAPGKSFLEEMKKRGIRPILLDWGEPIPDRVTWDLGDHVARILVPASHYLHGRFGQPINVVGYCMGGTLSIALAHCASSAVDRLAVIGAPWQFDAQVGVAAAIKDQLRRVGQNSARMFLHQAGVAYGAVPSDLFQFLFAMLAPMQAVQKFSRFARMDPEGQSARNFLAIEHWLNDGVALPAPSASELLVDWYIDNLTGIGLWQVENRKIKIETLPCPALGITGSTDHIVPSPVAAPIGRYAPSGSSFELPAGHVGMIVGRRAHAEVAYRLCSFLSENRLS